MHRRLTLRQIEGFKAVIERGTISNAALMLNISQPAMSKLINHLEADTGLILFDRIKGRLAPTDQGKRLYEEVDRIFAGVRQVENAVDAICREEQGQLTIGVMPALSAKFIQQVTMGFLKTRPNVFCSVQSQSSERITDWLVTRKLDVGLVVGRFENPYVVTESLIERPLVCIMPRNHPLALKKKIKPKDLHQIDYVGFNTDTFVGQRVATMLEASDVRPKLVLVANIVPTVCEFVAAGLGVSLVHPLEASGYERVLAVRKFEPSIFNDFQLCRSRESRNAQLVQAFLQETRDCAKEICSAILSEPG